MADVWDRLDKQFKPTKPAPIKLECENCGDTENAVYRRTPLHGGSEGVYCLACYYKVGSGS